MSLRRMDLRPDSVRGRVRDAGERRLVTRAATVAGVLFVVAWSVGAIRLEAARRSHAEVVSRAEVIMGIENELRATDRELEVLGDDLAAWRRVSVPMPPGALVAAVVEVLPESATIERLGLDAGSLTSVPLRGPRDGGATRNPRLVAGELEGFAASDEAVAAVVDALRRRPFFDSVRVESTRHRDLSGDSARSFRIAFEIDLETASPVPADLPEQGGGS